MITKREMMERRLWAYGQWSGNVTEAGRFGNSPSAKIEEIGRTGLNSHGTAYLDRSSETMSIPERHREIDACVQMLPAHYARVFNAAFVLFIDHDLPRRLQDQRRAHHAGVKPETYLELKSEIITAMIQIEAFLFGQEA